MYISKSEAHKYILRGRLDEGVQIYEFEITLEDTNPVVWRKVAVPGDYTFEQLGRVAACVIGWIPRFFHLFGHDGGFIRGYDPYSFGVEVESDDEEKDEGGEPKKKKVKKNVAREMVISDHFNLVDKKSITMDYGSDGWMHEITLVNIRERDGKYYPKCIEGRNACPPEDCGGADGYEYLLSILKNPKNEEYEEMKEWMKDMGHKRFNPTKFKLSSVAFN